MMIKLTSADNQIILYGWALSKQDEGEFAGCWMTDQVVPLEASPAAPPVKPEQGADDKGKLTI